MTLRNEGLEGPVLIYSQTWLLLIDSSRERVNVLKERINVLIYPQTWLFLIDSSRERVNVLIIS